MKKNKYLVFVHSLILLRFVLLVFIGIIGAFFYNSFFSNAIIVIPILIVIALTDFLDGHIARKKCKESIESIRIFDSLSDKIGIIISCIGFYFSHVINPVIFLIILLRELLMLIFGTIIYFSKRYITGNIWGRIYYAFLLVYIMVIFPSDLMVINNDIDKYFIIIFISICFINVLSHCLQCFNKKERIG